MLGSARLVSMVSLALSGGALAAGGIGCRSESSSESGTSLSASSAGAASIEEATDGAREETGELELLDLTFTSGVAGKAPKDLLVQTAPGNRVYAHLTVRNRTGKPRSVVLDFTVNGHQRTHLELNVEPSWSWRTWGYNTVLENDKPGELELVVQGDDGIELSRATLPIGKNVRTEPWKPDPQ